MVFKTKAYKKGLGISINLTGAMAKSCGVKAGDVEIETDGKGFSVRMVAPNAIASIIGIDCFTWEDVEYVGRMMREKGYVPGVNGPKAGVPHGEESEESHHEP